MFSSDDRKTCADQFPVAGVGRVLSSVHDTAISRPGSSCAGPVTPVTLRLGSGAGATSAAMDAALLASPPSSRTVLVASDTTKKR